MLHLEVVDTGGSLSILLLTHLNNKMPVREGSWQAATPTAAYSCNWTAAVSLLRLKAVSGGGMVLTVIV
jgi:hypothetical protein